MSLASAGFAVVLALFAQIAHAAPPASLAGDGVASAAMESVGSTRMIEEAGELDGLTVEFSGEAIGSALARGGMAWVNIADPGGAMGVWMSAEAVRSIRYFGSYSFRGDELRVKGVFHRACGEHGGDMDIHAMEIEVIRLGERILHPPSAARLLFAAVLVVTAVAAQAELRARDRRRRERVTARPWPTNGGALGRP